MRNVRLALLVGAACLIVLAASVLPVDSRQYLQRHLLDGEFLNAVVDVETLQDWQIMLPSNSAFEQAPLP